jgi:hypothetical protein
MHCQRDVCILVELSKQVRLDAKEGGGAWGGAHPANAMCAYSIVLTPRRVLKGRRARDLPIAVPALAFVESVRNATFSAVEGGR